MSDVIIRKEGCAGRITLNRPQALNALTLGMVQGIAQALRDWADDPGVRVVISDGAGERAFCAGGDITALYAAGMAGDFSQGRTFWQEEYRLNAMIAGYRQRHGKPVVSFLQGFTMGGGVGIGCHANLRFVGDTSRIAMPECGIGLVPDAGGSMLLARAPGRIGTYLGLTGARMGPGDAISAGFADIYVPEAFWPAMIHDLSVGKELAQVLRDNHHPLPGSPLVGTFAPGKHELFNLPTIADIREGLARRGDDFARETLAAMDRASPLSLACTLAMLRRLGRKADIRTALELEYRFGFHAQEHGDFLEGIRAAVIDKDRAPRWKPAPTPEQVDAMLAPLGPDTLTFEDTP